MLHQKLMQSNGFVFQLVNIYNRHAEIIAQVIVNQFHQKKLRNLFKILVRDLPFCSGSLKHDQNLFARFPCLACAPALVGIKTATCWPSSRTSPPTSSFGNLTMKVGEKFTLTQVYEFRQISNIQTISR